MYEFEAESNTKYTFETDSQITYEVTFSPMEFIFDDENALKSNIYELSIELVTKLEDLPPKDEKIEMTIVQIVRHFFQNEPLNFEVFHVSNIDKKVISRRRLFSNWFEKHNNDFLERFEKIIEDKSEIFYISLIFRTDNSLKSDIIDFFANWIEDTNAIK